LQQTIFGLIEASSIAFMSQSTPSGWRTCSCLRYHHRPSLADFLSISTQLLHVFEYELVVRGCVWVVQVKVGANYHLNAFIISHIFIVILQHVASPLVDKEFL
jgi:hypothetical protein